MNQDYMRQRTWTARVLGQVVVTLAVGLAALGASAALGGPTRTVLVMGDSLSAAYGLAPEEGWVALTAARMAREYPGWRVVNASVSGETTAGGAARIEGELTRNRPEVVIIELGGNDGLRGLPLKQTRANLEKMVSAARAVGARVLLVGMRMPPNLGKAYTEGFAANFRTVAETHQVSLLPFLLEPIAMDRASFQPDNIHPVAAAQPKLSDHVWPALAALLK
ncbi:arylesterase [Melittangium boletus]|uniref:Arylesterase n=1 Tax=Melittangium boletus DSM 14713 TaxID=1294270 RepID=A0A250IMZ1_9BACT|nr:arylesterase [Melittangium boletus]ATB32638.1 arylesterase [Melittangium boletus DSM 14713]